MGLESVGGLAMHIILSKLGPYESASVDCLSKRFRVWASEDSLWAQFCSQDLNLALPLDPYGNRAPSFKAAYRAWREGFAMYPWPLVLRAKSCWSKLKEWLAANFPEVLPTLRKGASEDEIEEFEKSLKVKLPLPTRVLYRFCDGQELPNEDFIGSLPSSLLGVIGGYTLYEHLINVYLLPLNQVIADTKGITQQLGFSSRSSKYIVVAASCTYSEKIFFLNCSSGQLFVGTRNLVTDGEMLPCVPEASINLKGAQQQDAMLLWLEEHGRRLHDGIIKVRKEGKIRSINLFPEQPPLCSSAITNGVKFGKGLYFADLVSKSAQYCFTDWKNPVGLMLLSEVALGDVYELTKSKYMDKPPKGKHSTKGLGKKEPLESEYVNWKDDVVVPCGKPVASKVKASELMYNEYIVYNTAQVRASAALVPEFSDLQNESEKFLFAYSIRMSLSSNGCVINGLTFNSCQLYWRHWIIRANDAIVSDVNGEAVIGKFPLLRPGEEEFVYESCTSLPASRGSVEGSFTFVPGRLVDAKGSPFAVEVARFPLKLPDYIF